MRPDIQPTNPDEPMPPVDLQDLEQERVQATDRRIWQLLWTLERRRRRRCYQRLQRRL